MALLDKMTIQILSNHTLQLYNQSWFSKMVECILPNNTFSLYWKIYMIKIVFFHFIEYRKRVRLTSEEVKISNVIICFDRLSLFFHSKRFYPTPASLFFITLDLYNIYTKISIINCSQCFYWLLYSLWLLQIRLKSHQILF